MGCCFSWGVLLASSAGSGSRPASPETQEPGKSGRSRRRRDRSERKPAMSMKYGMKKSSIFSFLLAQDVISVRHMSRAASHLLFAAQEVRIFFPFNSHPPHHPLLHADQFLQLSIFLSSKLIMGMALSGGISYLFLPLHSPVLIWLKARRSPMHAVRNDVRFCHILW